MISRQAQLFMSLSLVFLLGRRRWVITFVDAPYLPLAPASLSQSSIFLCLFCWDKFCSLLTLPPSFALKVPAASWHTLGLSLLPSAAAMRDSLFRGICSLSLTLLGRNRWCITSPDVQSVCWPLSIFSHLMSRDNATGGTEHEIPVDQDYLGLFCSKECTQDLPPHVGIRCHFMNLLHITITFYLKVILLSVVLWRKVTRGQSEVISYFSKRVATNKNMVPIFGSFMTLSIW